MLSPGNLTVCVGENASIYINATPATTGQYIINEVSVLFLNSTGSLNAAEVVQNTSEQFKWTASHITQETDHYFMVSINASQLFLENEYAFSNTSLHSITILENNTTAQPEPSFTLHEWGVFQQEYNSSVTDILTAPKESPVIVRKPAIYISSDSPVDINVSVALAGDITQTIPNASINGSSLSWNVSALTNGSVVCNGTAYDYLFYEGQMNCTQNIAANVTNINDTIARFCLRNIGNYTIDHTFAVYGNGSYLDRRLAYVHITDLAPGDGEYANASMVYDNTTNFSLTYDAAVQEITAVLNDMGLTANESNDMIDYWKDAWLFPTNAAPYANVIYFIPQDEYNRTLPLNVTPSPASVVRVGAFFVTDIPIRYGDFNAANETPANVTPPNNETRVYGNTTIVYPANNSEVNGTIFVKTEVETCNCTNTTALYVDGNFTNNGTTNETVVHNGTYYEVFYNELNTSVLSDGWHVINVTGKHPQYFDEIRLYVNNTAVANNSDSNTSANNTDNGNGTNNNTNGNNGNNTNNDTNNGTNGNNQSTNPNSNATTNISVNHPPVIVSVTLSVPSVGPNGTISIIAAANDQDNDTLTFTYNCSGGTISGSGSTIIWQAPSQPGIYAIGVRARDNLSDSSAFFVNITVFAPQNATVASSYVIETLSADKTAYSPGEQVRISAVCLRGADAVDTAWYGNVTLSVIGPDGMEIANRTGIVAIPQSERRGQVYFNFTLGSTTGEYKVRALLNVTSNESYAKEIRVNVDGGVTGRGFVSGFDGWAALIILIGVCGFGFVRKIAKRV